MTSDTAIVIFRIWRRGLTGQGVIALFPLEPGDSQGLYCLCYEHVGQHGAADYQYILSVTDAATPAEYADLLAELRAIGYDLVVRQRAPRGYKAALAKAARAFEHAEYKN